MICLNLVRIFHSTFVSGTFIAHEHIFTCLNYLRNVSYNVTETTKNFSSISILDYELLFKYLSTLKNASLPNLPDVKVSLPSLTNIGWE